MCLLACIARHTHAYAHVSFGLIDIKAWNVSVAIAIAIHTS